MSPVLEKQCLCFLAETGKNATNELDERNCLAGFLVQTVAAEKNARA